MKYESYTDEELIQFLREGDSEISDYLLEKYKPLVRKQTNAMYLIGGENEDLIQEGMIGLFKAIQDFDFEKEVKFFSFAKLCIDRQLFSALEASNRKKHIPLNSYISFSRQDGADGVGLEEQLEGCPNPEDLLIEKEVHKEFFQKLQLKLSPMEKKVLYLYLEGKSYMEIGINLNKSSKSINNCLQRIRAKIKTIKEED